ncbi:MAG: CPBP family intramembrane metalloprotease [Bacteroidia bacterium]|nr:CPBP family intramembrane metalloprotease [Bacteroidia bacterium]
MLAPIHIRYVLTILFMVLYISLGFIFRLEAVSYLLLGVPLTVIFQLCIARQPLPKLWLRDSDKFRLNKLGWTITLCFIAFPIYKTIQLATQDELTLLNLGYYFATILGAFGAGYCYSNFTKKTANNFLLCFGITAILRMGFYFLPFLLGKSEFNPDYIRAIKSLLTYIPVAFVVEEVVFRGMLDTYIHQSKQLNGVWSALFISVLWGLWHLPLSADGSKPIWFVALGSITISLWGIILCIFRRLTGNIAVPGFSHAFADAIRDGLK